MGKIHEIKIDMHHASCLRNYITLLNILYILLYLFFCFKFESKLYVLLSEQELWCIFSDPNQAVITLKRIGSVKERTKAKNWRQETLAQEDGAYMTNIVCCCLCLQTNQSLVSWHRLGSKRMLRDSHKQPVIYLVENRLQRWKESLFYMRNLSVLKRHFVSFLHQL